MQPAPTVTDVTSPDAAGPGLRLPAVLGSAPSVTIAACIALALAVFAFAVPFFVADPFDLSGSSVLDAFTPPAWMADGNAQFPVGTDDQGRNLLTALAFGLRMSLIVGIFSVVIGLVWDARSASLRGLSAELSTP